MQHMPNPTPPTCPKMPDPPPPPVTFAITLKEEQPSQWHMIYANQDYGPGQYPPINVPCNTVGIFQFTITQGANFATDPIGVSPGPNKPPHAGVGNGQITITKQTPTELWFSDANNLKSHNQLNYVLYFNDNSTLDPIIDNNGCCGQVIGGGNQNHLVWYAIGIVAAILIVFLIVRMVRGGNGGQ